MPVFVDTDRAQSGLMAALLNISQFFIVAGAGPVSSTVVGHLKTCSIVALGWISGKQGANDSGIFGIFMALTGIVM
jgi:solute carrier family 35, member E3